MKPYDELVDDYLRAVEHALAGAPADRREALLADLSRRIAAKRAELPPQRETELEVRSILQLLGDPAEVAAEAVADSPAPPVVIEPHARTGAMLWVILTIAAVMTLCVVASLAAVLFLAAWPL